MYETDPRVIVMDETEYYNEKWLKENEIEKVKEVYLYDRNQITYPASTVGSFWLEKLYKFPIPNEDEQDIALTDVYDEEYGHYRNKYDIPEDKGMKIDDDVCNFSYSDDEKYREKWQDCINFLRENHPV